MGLTGFNFTDDGNSLHNLGSFAGSLDNRDAASQNDPFIKGYAFIRWVRVPDWVKAQFPNFEQFTATTFRALGGLSDITLEEENVPSGFNANDFGVASSLKKGNNNPTLSFTEWSGQPVRSMFQYWVSGIRDPETGVATYVSKSQNNRYGAYYHTGDLMYIVTRPDAHNVKNDIIEFACMWTNVFPKKIPLGHLNYTQGDRTLSELEIDFSGNFHMSPKIDDFAAKTLQSTNFGYRFMGDFKRGYMG